MGTHDITKDRLEALQKTNREQLEILTAISIASALVMLGLWAWIIYMAWNSNG